MVRPVETLDRDPVKYTRLLLGACRGLLSLHSMYVLHGDVAARNFLLDQAGEVYICDFDLSVELPSRKKNSAVYAEDKPLPLAYIAPETHRERVISYKTDIYMFGMFMWELWMGRGPWPEVRVD